MKINFIIKKRKKKGKVVTDCDYYAFAAESHSLGFRPS